MTKSWNLKGNELRKHHETIFLCLVPLIIFPHSCRLMQFNSDVFRNTWGLWKVWRHQLEETCPLRCILQVAFPSKAPSSTTPTALGADYTADIVWVLFGAVTCDFHDAPSSLRRRQLQCVESSEPMPRQRWERRYRNLTSKISKANANPKDGRAKCCRISTHALKLMHILTHKREQQAAS